MTPTWNGAGAGGETVGDARDTLLQRVRAYVALHSDEGGDRSVAARAAMEVIGGWTPSGDDHKARRLALRAVEDLVELADASDRGEDVSAEARLARSVLDVAESEHGALDDAALMHALALWLTHVSRREDEIDGDVRAATAMDLDEELRRLVDEDER